MSVWQDEEINQEYCTEHCLYETMRTSSEAAGRSFLDSAGFIWQRGYKTLFYWFAWNETRRKMHKKHNPKYILSEWVTLIKFWRSWCVWINSFIIWDIPKQSNLLPHVSGHTEPATNRRDVWVKRTKNLSSCPEKFTIVLMFITVYCGWLQSCCLCINVFFATGFENQIYFFLFL